jgi:hypothetical protein
LRSILEELGATTVARATPYETDGHRFESCRARYLKPCYEALAASGGTAPPGFSTAGFANAQNHYADSQNGNPYAVSRYEVACSQLSSH